MGKVTVYCPISGCTPEVASTVLLCAEEGDYTPAIAKAMEALADTHELASADDLCLIGPLDPSGDEYDGPFGDDDASPPELRPAFLDTIRIVPHCVMGDSWDAGYVDEPPSNGQERSYLVSFGVHFMVQTHALDIMALATQGRVTPLRLWRLAMQQGLLDMENFRVSRTFEGVEYGEITDQCGEQCPEAFPGFSDTQLEELEDGDIEVVKERLVHEGLFFVWMAPNRFPVAPTNHTYITAPSEAHPINSSSVVEKLPAEMVGLIVSFLPLRSLLNLAATSRQLRTVILGSDHLARVWMYHNAPWWIPVPTEDDLEDLSTTAPPTLPAREWNADTRLTIDFPFELDWAYVGRCMRSGSMRNRRRIWNAALDIERVADLAGM